MKRYLVLGIILIVCQSALAQKKKNRSRNDDDKDIPALEQTFERFSIFRFMNNAYVHQETNNVFVETFLEVNPGKETMKLPGIGAVQICTFKITDCDFLEDSAGVHVARIPIDCNSQDGATEKRDLWLHYIYNKRRIQYLFSIDVPGTEDRILYHSYSDQELGSLIASQQIRFK